LLIRLLILTQDEEGGGGKEEAGSEGYLLWSGQVLCGTGTYGVSTHMSCYVAKKKPWLNHNLIQYFSRTRSMCSAVVFLQLVRYKTHRLLDCLSTMGRRDIQCIPDLFVKAGFALGGLPSCILLFY